MPVPAHRRRRPHAHRSLVAAASRHAGRPAILVAFLVLGLAADQLVAARPAARPAIRPAPRGPGGSWVAGHYDDCCGLEVHIDHGDGLVSWYRHPSRIDVKVGASVSAGAVTGLVGETGCALGSHLHFAIRRGATFVDPLRYLPPG